jgi:hypothetical protein
MRVHRARPRRTTIARVARSPAGEPLTHTPETAELARQWFAMRCLIDTISNYRLMFGSRALLRAPEAGVEFERRIVEIQDGRDPNVMPEVEV